MQVSLILETLKNFHCNKACLSVPIFHLTNIIFTTAWVSKVFCKCLEIHTQHVGTWGEADIPTHISLTFEVLSTPLGWAASGIRKVCFMREV